MGNIQHQIALAVLVIVLAGVMPLSSRERKRKYETLSNQQTLEMLSTVEADIEKHYYDAGMHGLDLGKVFDQARQKIEHASSQDQALLEIAAAVNALKDSHTSFVPPVRPYAVDYGWMMEAIGDTNCYVTAVRPDSDALKKGLMRGDQIVSVNGVALMRQDLEYVEYGYSIVPQSGLRLGVRSPDGQIRQLIVMAKVMPGQEAITHVNVMHWIEEYRPEKHDSRYYRVDAHTQVWKFPSFLVDPAEVDGLANKVHPYQTLILDLRGNRGGSRAAMDKFIGEFFAANVRVGDVKTRGQSQPEIAKSRGKKAFAGKLIVLIDSQTASAAEIVARVVQLEKRGIVLGDRSAGAVGEADDYVHAVALDATNVTQYRTRVTVANLLMSDGKSLENVGVTPDERILPTPADLAAGSDPVLARALELAGTKMTPQEAGKIFPMQWPKDKMPEID